MKIFLLLFLSILIQVTCIQPATARLGEDEVQCEERYGIAKKEFIANDKTFPLVRGVETMTRTYIYQG